MKPGLLILILTSVACSSVAQLLLKTGMSQPTVVQAVQQGDILEMVQRVGMNLWVLAGMALYFFGAIIWLFVLAQAEVSFAYPFVGLGFILTLALGKLIMGDVITAQRIVGTLLVTAGVVIIARP